MFKFVYFDVGGVAIKDCSKTNKWEEMKRSKNITDPNYDTWFDELEIQLCLGKATLSGTDFVLSDFIDQLEVNKSIWPIIELAKSKYKVGLLTNMYTGMLDAIKNRNILPNIKWDEEIDSSIIGLQKPDPEIYKYAQKRSGVNSDEILFVENSIDNIETAKAFGWQTFLYDSGDYEKSNRDLAKILS